MLTYCQKNIFIFIFVTGVLDVDFFKPKKLGFLQNFIWRKPQRYIILIIKPIKIVN